MTEYEIKLLGEPVALRKIFNYFHDAAPVKRNRNYAFNTYYLDSDDRFFNSGYSLRHRTGVFEIDKESGTELKALDGSIGEVSARLEIEQLGACPRSNYYALKACEEYPDDAPDIPRGRLSIDFATSVRRVERQGFVRIDNQIVLIEAALDDIAYLRPQGDDGDGLFDKLLMPCGLEHELEFELKTYCDPDMFFNWVRENAIKDVPIEITTKSKAIRGRKLL